MIDEKIKVKVTETGQILEVVVLNKRLELPSIAHLHSSLSQPLVLNFVIAPMLAGREGRRKE